MEISPIFMCWVGIQTIPGYLTTEYRTKMYDAEFMTIFSVTNSNGK